MVPQDGLALLLGVGPDIALLIPESGDPDRSVGIDVHDRIAIVGGTRALNHSDHGAIVDSTDRVQLIFVTVALEDGQYVPRGFQRLTDIGVVLHSVAVADVKPLVSKDDDGLLVGLKIGFEPFQFRWRNIGVGPLKVSALVGFTVAAKTGVEHDKVDAPAIEGIVGLLFLDSFKEFIFLEGVDAVIAKHIMSILAELGKFMVDGFKVSLFNLDLGGGVNEVAQFDNEGRLVFLELSASFFQLAECFSIVPTSGGGFVRVVEIGDHANSERSRFFVSQQFGRFEGSCGQDQDAILHEGSATVRVHLTVEIHVALNGKNGVRERHRILAEFDLYYNNWNDLLLNRRLCRRSGPTKSRSML